MNFFTQNPFFLGGGGVNFYKLTRNPFFSGGGGVKGGGRVSVRA